MSIRAFAFSLAALALAVCACLCFVPAADAAWGDGGCPTYGPVGPAPTLTDVAPSLAAPADDGRPYWRGFKDGDADCLALVQSGRQIGCYRYSTGKFHPWDGGNFGPVCAPPLPVPGLGTPACQCDRCADGCKCHTQDECADGLLPGDLLPTGVIPEKITGRDRYTKNGKVVPKAKFFEALEAGGDTVPDDSASDSVTVVAPDPLRASLAAALPAALKDKCVVQTFTPGDWHVAGYRWDAPCIVRQRPDGAVVWHVSDADPEKARKIDPNYDPTQDPTLTVKPNVILPPYPAVPGWVWGAAAGGCGLLCFGGFALLFLVVILVLLFRSSK